MQDKFHTIILTQCMLSHLQHLKKISVDYKDKGLSFNELKNKYLSCFKNELAHSNLFCELLSANLETMDLNQLKQEINDGKMIVENQYPLVEKISNISSIK